jgi:transposase
MIQDILVNLSTNQDPELQQQTIESIKKLSENGRNAFCSKEVGAKTFAIEHRHGSRCHDPHQGPTQAAADDLGDPRRTLAADEPILKEFWPRKATGRKVANWRKMLNGIISRLRSGCQWEKLPERYGPKSTVHDWFQRWVQGGIFEKIWAVLVAECDELGGVDWQWQSADAMLGKARFGGKKTGKNPTDRGKKGTKKSLVTAGDGGPLGVVIAGANVVEQKLLKGTIEAIVVERPDPDEVQQNLCLDKGYDNPRSREAAAEGG